MGVSSGQGSGAVANGLVGDADDFFLQQLVGERGNGCQVQIGEEHQAFAEEDVFLLDGLLDLDDHVGVAPHVVGGADDFRAGGLILVVGEGREVAGMGLHQDLVPGIAESFYAGRGNADTALVVFDFFGNSNDHQGFLRGPRSEEKVGAGLKILHRGGKQPPEFTGQNGGRDWLGEEDGALVGLGLHHVATDENGGNSGAQGADAGDEARSVDAGHPGIGHDGGNSVDLLAGGFEAKCAVLAGNHFVSCSLQDFGEQESDRTIVLDHQNSGGVGSNGSILASCNHSLPTCGDPGTGRGE